MRILSGAEMAAADERSVAMGIPIAKLMDNAGRAVARFVLRRGPSTGLIVVLCGKGHNGGDGMVAARYLATAGREVRVVLLGAAADLQAPVLNAWESAATEAHAGSKIEGFEAEDKKALESALESAVLVLDAIVGTGFKPPLRGLASDARDLLAKSEIPVIAVDLPSGWDADATTLHAAGGSTQTVSDSQDLQNQPIRAAAVVTFAAPKLAHIFGHLTPGLLFGPVVVADIGIPQSALPGDADLHWGGSAKAIAETPRGIDGNKGRFGHVLLLGGAFGKSGAPSMMSLAALRTGAGLVTAAVPRSILLEVARITPELMTAALAESPGGEGGLSLDTLEPKTLEKLLKKISVVGVGPGLGEAGTTPEFVRRFVAQVTVPMVLDADALNCLDVDTSILKQASAGKDAQGNPRTLVLTPHPGEMARLLGCSIREVEADRLNLARKFATEHGVTLVLKGWRTLIAHPNGRVAVNTTGNPSMAKGGSGDILTGIVAAMLAQYPDHVAEAVEAAAFLHGLAGDFACLAQDEHTVLATDTVAHLQTAFRARVTDADGFTWIAGTAVNGAFAKRGHEKLAHQAN